MQTITPQQLLARIELPEQDAKKLTFCASAKRQRVQDWVNLLHPTQVSQTGGLLYNALPELARLKTNAQTRYDMLEILRPYVQNTVFSLSKLYMLQAAAQNDGKKAIILAQALQKHMVNGYVLVVREDIATRGKKIKAATDVRLITALHRAMQGLGLLFLRCFQLYTQPPAGLWLSLHSLFRVADHHNLLDIPIADDTQENKKASTIQGIYFQAILLSASRPHQLNPQEITCAFEQMQTWSTQVRFRTTLDEEGDGIYYVNLDSDEGPKYKSRQGDTEKDHLKIELDLRQVVQEIERTGNTDLDNPAEHKAKSDTLAEISSATLSHLSSAWGQIAKRRQERKETQITVDVCIGIKECHYFFNESRDFEDFLKSQDKLSEQTNTPPTSFTPAETFSNKTTQQGKKQAQRIEVQNISGNGYCLLWRGASSVKIEAGDVIGIREMGTRMWKIGAARWIRQKKSASQIGVQILSELPKAAAVAQTYDIGGEADYTRAILLPSQFNEAPPSLITPSLPFHTGDRVKLMNGGNIVSAKLDKCVFSTSIIRQFTYRVNDS